MSLDRVKLLLAPVIGRETLLTPREAGNLKNNFASFSYYSHDDILPMSLLHFFLIMFPEDYLE